MIRCAPGEIAGSEHRGAPAIVKLMGKWIAILLAAMVGLAILGFLVDAARAIAGILFVGCLLVLAARLFTRGRS
jgi:hypothetical protein